MDKVRLFYFMDVDMDEHGDGRMGGSLPLLEIFVMRHVRFVRERSSLGV